MRGRIIFYCIKVNDYMKAIPKGNRDNLVKTHLLFDERNVIYVNAVLTK